MNESAEKSGELDAGAKPAELVVVHDPVKSELEALKAKRAQLREAAQKRADDREAEETLAAERQGLIDDEAIEAAELEHGAVGKRIAVVNTDMGAVIVKRPHAAVYKRYQDRGQCKSADLEKLVRPCLVYPTQTRFEEIVEELPGTLTRVGDAVVLLAGFRAEDIGGK